MLKYPVSITFQHRESFAEQIQLVAVMARAQTRRLATQDNFVIHYGALERPPAEFGLSRGGQQQQPAAAPGSHQSSDGLMPSQQQQPQHQSGGGLPGTPSSDGCPPNSVNAMAVTAGQGGFTDGGALGYDERQQEQHAVLCGKQTRGHPLAGDC